VEASHDADSVVVEVWVYAERLAKTVRYWVDAGKVCVVTIVGPSSDFVTICVGTGNTVVSVMASIWVVTV